MHMGPAGLGHEKAGPMRLIRAPGHGELCDNFLPTLHASF